MAFLFNNVLLSNGEAIGCCFTFTGDEPETVEAMLEPVGEYG
jgi:hypothetical protein